MASRKSIIGGPVGAVISIVSAAVIVGFLLKAHEDRKRADQLRALAEGGARV